MVKIAVILTQVSMRYIFHKLYQERGNLFSILSTTVVSTIVSFCMVLAFANLVSPQVLGTYQYIISIVSIIGAVSFTGMGTSIIRALGKHEVFFLSSARQYLYLGSLPALAIGTTVGLYYAVQGNWLLSLSIFFSLVLYLGILIATRFCAIYMALDNVKTANYLVKLQVIAPLAVVLPALFFIKEAYLLSILYFGSNLLFLIFGIWIFKSRELEKDLTRDTVIDVEGLERTRVHLTFGFHQSIVTLINTASTHADKIILFQILGPQQTAIYFIAVSIPDRIRGVIKSFGPLFFARFARHSPEAVTNKMLKRFLLLLAAILPICILYIFLTPIMFKLLLPQYENSIFLSQTYAITLLAAAVIIPDSILKAHGQSRDFYAISLIHSVVKPLLIFLGTVFYGLQGAIVGASVGVIINLIANFVLAKTTYKKDIK